MTSRSFAKARRAAALCLAGGLLLAAPVVLASPTPGAIAVLFDAKHLTNISKGGEAVYNFERKVSEPKLLGEPFTDKIRIGVLDEEATGARTVSIKVFTGDRARPEQQITGMTGNPLLVVFLDRSVSNFGMLAGGSRPFLKNRMKEQLGTNSKVEPVSITYQGKQVAGYRVKWAPFVGDPNALKMQGFDGSRFEIVVSDAVPGHFVETVGIIESPQPGSPRLEERTLLDGVGEIK